MAAALILLATTLFQLPDNTICYPGLFCFVVAVAMGEGKRQSPLCKLQVFIGNVVSVWKLTSKGVFLFGVSCSPHVCVGFLQQFTGMG